MTKTVLKRVMKTLSGKPEKLSEEADERQDKIKESLEKALKQRFEDGVGTHYDWQTRERGYMVVTDDEGNERQADLMSLSIGVTTADDGPFADIREITEVASSARREGCALDGAALIRTTGSASAPQAACSQASAKPHSSPAAGTG